MVTIANNAVSFINLTNSDFLVDVGKRVLATLRAATTAVIIGELIVVSVLLLAEVFREEYFTIVFRCFSHILKWFRQFQQLGLVIHMLKEQVIEEDWCAMDVIRSFGGNLQWLVCRHCKTVPDFNVVLCCPTQS